MILKRNGYFKTIAYKLLALYTWNYITVYKQMIIEKIKKIIKKNESISALNNS